jgi:simple sugar transport system permease protein
VNLPLLAVNDSVLVVVLSSAVAYGTPLLYAALGELLAERSGVLNLGVEGMMLVGAVMGFWAVQRIGGPGGLGLLAAILVAALAGAAVALIHAFLVITLQASQIVSGLALTIFAGAAGLSSYLGNDLNLADVPARHAFKSVDVFGLGDASVVGPILFDQTWLVYASWACVVLVALYLSRTRVGLNARAVGESPQAADAMGISVAGYRYAHTLAGGAFAGVGGACFTLSITPQWTDGLTQGAGWIAIALVIFAFWRPALCLVGAYLFGAFEVLPVNLQARGILKSIPSELFTALPYVMTVVVLVVVSSGVARQRLGAPGALGVPYVREER